MWGEYVLDDSRFEFSTEDRVLDLGCGHGEQLARLVERGIQAYGIDPSAMALQRCRARNLRVVQGSGERLPISSSSVGGVLCKVVLPYSDERAAVTEIGRVLSVGGKAYIVSHGAGYYLRYLLQPDRPIYRAYGVRALLNTWLWSLSGRRLPGFLGDTLYQSRRRLSEYYRAAGLELEEQLPSQRYLGFPVFIYDLVRRSAK